MNDPTMHVHHRRTAAIMHLKQSDENKINYCKCESSSTLLILIIVVGNLHFYKEIKRNERNKPNAIFQLIIFSHWLLPSFIWNAIIFGRYFIFFDRIRFFSCFNFLLLFWISSFTMRKINLQYTRACMCVCEKGGFYSIKMQSRHSLFYFLSPSSCFIVIILVLKIISYLHI